MKKTLLFLLFFLQLSGTFAQSTQEITNTFGSYPGFNDDIICIKEQPDGKILVGGRFTSYKGAIQNRLIRLNSDGSKDTSFDIGTGFNFNVEAILLQPDGKIIVGGSFSKFQDTTQDAVIRLNPDGSKDQSFVIGYGGNTVYALAIQSDGKILVGGGFQSFDGISSKSLVRLNTNGSTDPNFKPKISDYRYIKSIIVQPNGKILIEGNFSVPQNEIVRLNTDGSHDPSFDIGTNGFQDNNVQSMALQSDGKIIVAGTFSSYKGITENGLIRLNSDGSKDLSFDVKSGFNKISPDSPDHIYYGIRNIVIQADEKILIMGNFISYQGINSNGLVRINTDGSRDNSFNIDTQFTNDPTKSKTITLQSNGKLLVGWDITNNQNITQKHLTRLNADGTKDSSLKIGTGLNFAVNSIVKQSDGKILVGGNFTNYKEASQNNLIRLNSDKTKDNSFSLGSGFNGSVNSIVLQDDGKIIVGGKFTKYQESTQNYLIRLNTDGTKDSSFNIGIGFDNQVNSITIQPDGKILVGGDFKKYQGISKGYLIRLNRDGSNDDTFKLGTYLTSMSVNGKIVNAIVVQPDGKILVGGGFEKYQNLTQDGLIRLNSDGTKDTSLDIGTGFSSDIYSIILQNDGKILIGGAFESYKGISQKKLIRLNTDGSKDNSFDVGLTFQDCIIYSSVLQNDGKIIVGSYSYNDQKLTENNLVRLNSDGSKDNDFLIGVVFFNNNKTSSYVKTILQSNNELIIGGDFTAYQGNNQSAYLIGLNSTKFNLSNEDFIKENKFFSVWPNPVKNTLNINSLNESNYSVKIYDLLGRLIYTKENVNTSIDVSSFTSGLYLIKIKAENGEASQKFIKI
ncbi:T9SS type A sorting domain-containing protein [Flavobacterium chungangensis]|uniref:T9SS type A sorting domain-containing protein n=1 Tax=Flavobacterium chungangensis TaxID=2708132 RepID=A0ABV8Z9Y1_9FLAO